ncbi:MAG: MFS transporter [Acidobacteriota bacterium]
MSSSPSPEAPDTPSRQATNSRASKYSLIGTLYVAQAIPLGFFITAMPVILRSEGMPIELVGLFSAIAFPWLLKFLWAPLVDRYRWRWMSRGHYLSWILLLQVLAIASVLGLAAVDLGSQLGLVIGLAAFFMVLSATQDIATDGLSVRALASEERGPGNGIQVGGYYLGQVLGGGFLLILFAQLGWSSVFIAMALLLALPVPWVLRFREPAHGADDAASRVGYGALRRFFTRPGTLQWVGLLLLFRSGEAMATFSFNQMLLDLGLGLTDIGLLAGLLYALGALAGSLLGGALVPVLGRRPAILGFAALQCAAILSYLLPASGRSDLWTLAASLVLVSFAGGASTAALYTAMMDASRQESAGTDFTLQQALCAIGPVVGTGLSGFSVAAWGFGGHFLLCAAIAFAAFLLAMAQSLPADRAEMLPTAA